MTSKRVHTGLTITVAVLAGLLGGASPASAAPATQKCSEGYFCGWEGPGYQGSTFKVRPGTVVDVSRWQQIGPLSNATDHTWVGVNEEPGVPDTTVLVIAPHTEVPTVPRVKDIDYFKVR